MTPRKTMKRMAMSAACALAGGSAFLSLPSCEAVLTALDPCSTLFAFCDANDVDLLFADIPDFDLYPTCTIPFYVGCSAGNIFPEGKP